MDEQSILNIIKKLYPSITTMYSDDELLIYINICMPIVAIECASLSVEQQEYACALLVLDLCLAQSADGTWQKSGEIKDAKTESGQSSKSRWRMLYDMIVGGASNGDNQLYYVAV